MSVERWQRDDFVLPDPFLQEYRIKPTGTALRVAAVGRDHRLVARQNRFEGVIQLVKQNGQQAAVLEDLELRSP